MTSRTATVETLTAEVRILMVGSRQVTLSVYGQLDSAPFDTIEPFGRVRPRGTTSYEIQVIGRDHAGNLVRSWLPEVRAWPKDDHGSLTPKWAGNHAFLHDAGSDGYRFLPHVCGREHEAVRTVLEWRSLPLIVLAGLR